MNEPKNDLPKTNAAPAGGPATNAEKVRSSRYEWEKNGNENDRTASGSGVAGKSLLSSVRNWLKKLFSANHSFFDNDDDATPSAA
jgi:hypothetical protein